MKQPSSKTAFFILAGWFLLNAFQSFFTELIHDEAYYWVYAQHLDWGYFDQPPMTAIMIWLGYALFQNEFGVRLLFILANVASLWLIWKMTDQQKPKLFFGLAFAALIAHLGFLAVPDMPLLLFVALFFFFARKYLEKDSWITAMLLAVIVAAMGYSKYQGIIILVFALLPNLHLLKRPSFWLIPLFGGLLFFPHLYWQYLNDYPTFRYHLYDRLSEPYTFLHPVNYILGQLLIFGPLIGVLFAWAIFRFKSGSDFERMLKWTTIGVFGFFLLMSFRGRIEANWTIVAFVPLLLMTYKVFSARDNGWKLVKIVGSVSLVLFLIGRLYFMIDFLPGNMIPRNEIHGWDVWAKNIAVVAGDNPVVFNNNYQKASKYQFYSGKQAHSVNTVSYAGNQYDFMIEKEEELNDKQVLFISDWIGAKDTIFTPGQSPAPYKIIPSFAYNNRVKIKYQLPDFALQPDSTIIINALLVNPTSKTVDLTTNNFSIKVCYHWFEYRKHHSDRDALAELPVKSIKPGEEIPIKVNVKTPKMDGEYRFRLALLTAGHHGRNSAFEKVEIRAGAPE